MKDGLNTIQIKRKLSKIEGGENSDHRTIYNTKCKVKAAELDEKSVMDILFEML